MSYYDHATYLSLCSVFKVKLYSKAGLHFNFLGKKTIARFLFGAVNGILSKTKNSSIPHSFTIPVIVSGQDSYTGSSISDSITSCTVSTDICDSPKAICNASFLEVTVFNEVGT